MRLAGVLFLILIHNLGIAQIINPDFEVKMGWQKSGAHQSYTPDGETKARSGSKVAFFGGWKDGQHMSQILKNKFEPSTEYKLSAWFAPRKDGQTRYGGSWLRVIANKPGSGRYVIAMDIALDNPESWIQKSITFKTPSDLSKVPEIHGLNGEPTGRFVDINGATLEILIGKKLNHGDAYDQTYVDDVELTINGKKVVSPKIEIPKDTIAGAPGKRDMTVVYPSLDQLEVTKTSVETLNVIFDTPGKNSYDSMPLGNGETAANVWTEPDGQIAFTISRTDAWSGIGRLLKLGRLRMQVTPNPFKVSQDFTQTLDLETASISVKGSNGFEAKLWIDANTDVIRCSVQSDIPVDVKIWNDPWRNFTRTLEGGDRNSAYSMIGGPPEFFEVEPDVVAELYGDRIGWYHHNTKTCFPVTLELQSLTHVKDKIADPYIHRTFGVLVEGEGLQKIDPKVLKTRQPVKSLNFNAYTLTEQPIQPGKWIEKILAYAKKDSASASAQSLQEHEKWWREFWQRSWIYANGPKPEHYPFKAIVTPPRSQRVRIAADFNGKNNFVGKIARFSMIYDVLDATQIKSLVNAKSNKFPDLPGVDRLISSWDFSQLDNQTVPNSINPKINPLKLNGKAELVDSDFGKVVEVDGGAVFEVQPGLGDMRFGMTFEAWIEPGKMGKNGGRIFDYASPGSREGFLLDTYPGGDALRGIVYDAWVEKKSVLKTGEWAHVAMVFDQIHGQVIIYLNGEEIVRHDNMDEHKKIAAPGLFHMTQGYALQRFISACAGRGNFPIKFNGTLFTMAGVPVKWLGSPQNFDYDFRMWGPDYWFQNTRLPYYPMLSAGDYDLMEPLWNMYLNTMPMSRERTKKYFNHDGVHWPETITFFGTFNNQNYGWKRPADLPIGSSVNKHIRHYYSGILELLMMMFDRYVQTEDDTFAREKVLPLAAEVIMFYDKHYERDGNGKIRFFPSQSLETYQVIYGIVNPTPPIAGLRAIIPRMLNELPKGAATQTQIESWKRVLSELPEIPIDKERNIVKVAENFDRHKGGRGNGETPGLYALAPYRNFGLGKPGFDTIENTFDTLYGWYSEGWNQDAVSAAMLGKIEIASKLTYWSLCQKNAESRFPGFFGPNYDWVPDQDHAGTAMHAVQKLLLLSDGKDIHLFPAWPKEWDVSFKLHANYNTIIECVYKDQKIVKLDVTPESRKKDVINYLFDSSK